MTRQAKYEVVTPIGALIGPCLLIPDTNFDEAGVYKTKLKAKASDPQAAKFLELLEKVQQEEHDRQVQEAEAKKKGSGKKVKLADLPVEETNENGEQYLVFNFKSKASYTDRTTGQTVERKIALFDGKGKALTHDLKIGTGTVARISVFVSSFYAAPVGAGVTLRIRAVKILELVEPPLPKASSYGFSLEEEAPDPGGYGSLQDSKQLQSSCTVKDRDRTDLIVVHCSATGPKADIGRREITQWHLKRGFVTIGYHYVIRRDGTIENGRRESEIGAHVSGHNSNSIGVCMVGGVDAQGKPSDNFTKAQYDTLRVLLGQLKSRYEKAKILGHRDLSPDHHCGMRTCPGFEVSKMEEP